MRAGQRPATRARRIAIARAALPDLTRMFRRMNRSRMVSRPAIFSRRVSVRIRARRYGEPLTDHARMSSPLEPVRKIA
jgi:hypothetical protein